MKRIIRYLPLLMLASLAVGCGGRAPKNTIKTEPSKIFLPAVVPMSVPREECDEWLKEHYWDRFDFSDTLFIRQTDTLHMMEAFARYTALLLDEPNNPAPIERLMRKASVSRPMLGYFAWMGEQVLHDPNSPLRNDELYIPVLRAILDSPYYNDYERIAPAYELEMALRNRVGEAANDLEYTLASGVTRRLYDLKAEYVLLYINNPDCPMCREVHDALASSPMLAEMIEQGRLKLLALYPDEDLKAWQAHREEVPAGWINAYDRGCRLRNEGSYDLRAIPSIYLLDEEKKVLIKDSTDVAYIEEVIDLRN